MGVSAALRRLAFDRPTAFPVLGAGGGPVWARYCRERRARPTPAPHDADLLVLAGEIPQQWTGALRALLETFALPRAALWLPPAWPCEPPADVPLAAGAPHRALLSPGAPANRQLLADRPPAPWRGLGDHGQGGEGMMGGKPYGRPMAMTGPDPDGLNLGAVPTALGPFFPALPSGLQIELVMQGDRIGAVEAVRNRFPDRPADAARVTPELAPALRAAQGDEVRIADLERARIRSHLLWAASFLELAGLAALGRRFLGALETVRAVALEDLFVTAERSGLRHVCDGVGRIAVGLVQELALVGPVARGSGQPTDGRAHDPDYARLGFAVQVGRGGDVWARWQVRREECLQSARLLELAGTRLTGAAEAPRGAIARAGDAIRTPSGANLAVLERVLPGLLWPEAVLTIASLDLDMAEAALR